MSLHQSQTGHYHHVTAPLTDRSLSSCHCTNHRQVTIIMSLHHSQTGHYPSCHCTSHRQVTIIMSLHHSQTGHYPFMSLHQSQTGHYHHVTAPLTDRSLSSCHCTTHRQVTIIMSLHQSLRHWPAPARVFMHVEKETGCVRTKLHTICPLWVVCFVSYSIMQYVRDVSAQTLARAATLKCT